jgi:hypothetical protein
VVRNHILTNDTGEGSLMRYTKQITTDAINQYSAQYHTLIAQDLQFNWGRYVGSNITTSREFCILLTKKQWVHKSELPLIIIGHIDGHDCKLSRTTGLPLGMIQDTNISNFQVLRGGYNCGHQFFWVPDSAVPESVKARFNDVNNRAAELKGVNEIDPTIGNTINTDNINKVFVAVYKVNPELFARGFKEINTNVISRNANADTDLKGTISMKPTILKQLTEGLTNIQNNKPTTFQQEEAIATLHHEVVHNMNKFGWMPTNREDTQYMELANEFVARKTLPEFIEQLGGKLENISLTKNRLNSGYNDWVINYEKFCSTLGCNMNNVIKELKNDIINNPLNFLLAV